MRSSLRRSIAKTCKGDIGHVPKPEQDKMQPAQMLLGMTSKTPMMWQTLNVFVGNGGDVMVLVKGASG